MPLKVSVIKALQTLTPKCSGLTPQLITLPIVTVAVLSALVLTTAALPAQAAPQSKSQTSATKIIQATTAPIKSADGFDLYQTSTIKGDFNVFVSSQGIKIFDRKNITGIVAKPPLWDVYTYNNVTRRVCKQTFKAYKGMGHDADDTTGGANMLALPLAKGKPTDLHGIAAIECATSPEFQKTQLKDLERESADPRFPKWAEFLYADKALIPARAATILCRFYCVPDKGSIPLQFKYLSLRDELHTLLITSTLKPMKTLQNGFDPPNDGYKTVSDPAKLADKVKDTPLRKTIENVRKHNKQP
ncbi:MAG: hypothetical protein IPL73_19360 [Candidatus Obscuribacter sp.]|nr:hypothetical protein [Candidatus Obscuribacter sp.]MBK9204551.1 hypothetical protein [Candidatus Obscuribacter sp.]